jgi:predicted esterase
MSRNGGAWFTAALVGLQLGCASSQAVPTRATSQVEGATSEPIRDTNPVTPDPSEEKSAQNELENASGVTPTAPRTQEIGWHDLALDGLEPALVYYVPGGPKLVVTHGAGGHAEWHCEHYRRLFGGRVTLLCARGKKRYFNDPAQGYYYPDHLALAKEVLQMVDAFESRFEARRAGERYVYTGYSQGATMGAFAFASEGRIFSHLLLVEGGYADFSKTLARRFQSTGGAGVLFVCGTKPCHDRAQVAVRDLEALGVRSVLEWARGAGHRPDGPVTDAFMRGLPKLFSSDATWNRIAPQRPDDPLKGNG